MVDERLVLLENTVGLYTQVKMDWYKTTPKEIADDVEAGGLLEQFITDYYLSNFAYYNETYELGYTK